jgi:anthranilate phosphoribosyltransferase
MIREALEALVSCRDLTAEEAAAAMGEIMAGQATAAQIGAFLTALRMKGETVDEIAGMARVMRQHALKVVVPGPLIDVVGTGGDGLGTFNISTAAALVAAAAGLHVAKHGNRAASGVCGSADVLEACGVRIDLPPQGVTRCIQEVGIGFMFAPAFHPAMRHAAGPRRELGIRTVFNILGPLTNPAGAQAELLGVARAELGEKMAQVLGRLGTQRALVVHGEDGIDEMSVSAPTRVWELNKGTVKSYTVTPEEVGLARSSLSQLKGGAPQENRVLMERVLSGEPGPLGDAVALNAGGALLVGGAVQSLQDGVRRAQEVLKSGAGLEKLHALAALSQKLAPTT